jgi:hypothetical protein
MDECECDQAPQHHKLALGEINDLGDSVNYGEPKANKGIDAARGNAGNQILNKLR